MANDAPIKVRYKTDFEKLLYAESHISALQAQIKTVESEKLELLTDIDEILFECRKYKVNGVTRMINQKSQIRVLNKKVKEYEMQLGIK